MATVTVRRKPSYTELEAKVKELQDALTIAERNKSLRDVGWDMLHSQIAELQRENRGLRVDLSNARKLNEELSDQVEADEREIADLKASREVLQDFRQELGAEVDEANRVIAEMATELTELKADRNITLAENERLRAVIAEKEKLNNTAMRATTELTEIMLNARDERDQAKTEAEELRIELMEREARIDELEKQAEWLRSKNEEWAQVADGQKDTIEGLQKDVALWRKAAEENVDLAKQFHHEALTAEEQVTVLRNAVDEISEKSADFCAAAQYWEDRTHKLEEEMSIHVAEKDYLERQLKANEEEYDNLRKMYVELRDAGSTIANHFRANTFAN